MRQIVNPFNEWIAPVNFLLYGPQRIENKDMANKPSKKPVERQRPGLRELSFGAISSFIPGPFPSPIFLGAEKIGTKHKKLAILANEEAFLSIIKPSYMNLLR